MKDSRALSIRDITLKQFIGDLKISEQYAKRKFIDELKKRYYCDGDFKNRLEKNQDKINIEKLFFPYFYCNAYVPSLKYTRREHYFYTAGYHGTVSGDSVTIHRDIESEGYDVNVEKTGNQLGHHSHAKEFSHLKNLDTIFEYCGIKSKEDFTRYDVSFLESSQIIDDDIFEKTSDYLSNTKQHLESEIRKQINEYIKSDSGSDPYYSIDYTFTIYWCPVYKFTFEDATAYIECLQGLFVNKLEYPRSKEFEQTKNKIIKKNRRSNHIMFAVALLFTLLPVAEIVTLMYFSIPTICKYQNVMVNSDRIFEWIAVALSFIAWFGYNIPLFISLFLFTLDNSIIKNDFIQEEIKSGHQKYEKSKTANKAMLKHIGSFIVRVVIILAITFVHFAAGMMIMNNEIETKYVDKLQVISSMAFYMFM